MNRIIKATRQTVKQHGFTRTVLFILTVPIRIPLVVFGAGLAWIGKHLCEDYIGALIAGRLFHDED